MSLPGSQQRALGGIEETLLADDLRLGSLFAIFTRLTRHEAMPWIERVEPGPWLRLRPALAGVIGLIAVISVLMLSLLVPGRQVCPGTVTAAPGHIQLMTAGRQAACAAQQSTMKGNTPADPPLPRR